MTRADLEHSITRAFLVLHRAPEINFANYDEAQVQALNNAVIEAYEILSDAMGGDPRTPEFGVAP